MGKTIPSALALTRMRAVARSEPASTKLHDVFTSSLPPLLFGFLKKYPPAQLLEEAKNSKKTKKASQEAVITPTAPPPNSNVTPSAIPPSSQAAPSNTVKPTLPTSSDPKTDPSIHSQIFPNPFQPQKNFITGRWHGPEYGLRKQADLCKMAREIGIEHWLPYSVKKAGERERRAIERAEERKLGVEVKGKLWERRMKGKLEERKKAMLAMPQMMETWRERGKGKGWKKWPK